LVYLSPYDQGEKKAALDERPPILQTKKPGTDTPPGFDAF
jgi:hypothetical protein